MPSNGLIVIAGIKEGCEPQLRDVLNCVGNDVKGKRLVAGAREPHIDFPASPTIHFARLAILDDPDRGRDRKRLLLATDYDGSLHAHIGELLSLTAQPHAIWGCCEGYTGPASFPAFIKARIVAPQAYYIAFRNTPLAAIRRLLSQAAAYSAPPPRDPSPLVASARTILADILRFPGVALTLPGLLLRRGPFTTLSAARRVNATLDRVWWVWWFNLLTLNSFPAPAIRYSAARLDPGGGCAPAATGDEVTRPAAWDGTPPEDVVFQNQLTLVTVVKPEELPQLRAVLDVIDLYARRLSTPGSLVGIATIHTVRWALIDGGKRLLLVSNYDGTWENYIDEFAELILSGLSAIWSSSYGFPQLGPQDLAAFKEFLRCHQVPANVFYSAYPEGTVAAVANAMQQELARAA